MFIPVTCVTFFPPTFCSVRHGGYYCRLVFQLCWYIFLLQESTVAELETTDHDNESDMSRVDAKSPAPSSTSPMIWTAQFSCKEESNDISTASFQEIRPQPGNDTPTSNDSFLDVRQIRSEPGNNTPTSNDSYRGIQEIRPQIGNDTPTSNVRDIRPAPGNDTATSNVSFLDVRQIRPHAGNDTPTSIDSFSGAQEIRPVSGKDTSTSNDSFSGVRQMRVEPHGESPTMAFCRHVANELDAIRSPIERRRVQLAIEQLLFDTIVAQGE